MDLRADVAQCVAAVPFSAITEEIQAEGKEGVPEGGTFRFRPPLPPEVVPISL
jgi:hypothetical protein